MDDLARRIRMVSKLSGTFTLRSGAASETYFDKYRFEADPKLLLAIANAMAPLVPSGSNALAGLEMGGIPIVTMLRSGNWPTCCVYQKKAEILWYLPVR